MSDYRRKIHRVYWCKKKKRIDLSLLYVSLSSRSLSLTHYLTICEALAIFYQLIIIFSYTFRRDYASYRKIRQLFMLLIYNLHRTISVQLKYIYNCLIAVEFAFHCIHFLSAYSSQFFSFLNYNIKRENLFLVLRSKFYKNHSMMLSKCLEYCCNNCCGWCLLLACHHGSVIIVLKIWIYPRCSSFFL